MKKKSLTLILLISLSALLCLFFLKVWLADFDPQKSRPKDIFITKAIKLTDILYFSFSKETKQIPEYYLTVDSKDLIDLYQGLPKPFSKTILSNSTKISGQLTHNNQTYPVSLQVHGDLSNHWSLPKKSWDIKLKNNQTINGINRLKFIIPADRHLLFENFGLYLAQKFDLITPRHWLGNLYINNDLQGIYYIREDFNKNMLANNHRLDGDIFSELDDPSNLDSKGNPFPGSKNLWTDAKYWKKTHQATQTQANDFNQLLKLIVLLNQADDHEFKNKIGNLVDLDYFFRWQSHAVLLGSYRQDSQHNQALYLNPATNKFEIIPKEFAISPKVDLNRTLNPLSDRILSIPEFKLERDKVLSKYLTNNNLKIDLEYFNQLFHNYKSFFYQDQKKFLSNLGFNKTTKEQLKRYQFRFQSLQEKLANTKRLHFVGRLYPQYVCLSEILDQFASNKPDQLIFGGDFIPTNHSFKSITYLWSVFNQALNQVNIPFQLVPGNHDYYFYSYNQSLPQSQILDDNLLIYLDTNSANYPDPFILSLNQINFLKNALTSHESRVFIFLHHPVWLTQKTAGVNALYTASNWPQIEKLLIDYSHPVYILAGDGSRFIHHQNQNINYYISGLPKYKFKNSSVYLSLTINPSSVDVEPKKINHSKSCQIKLTINNLIDDLFLK